MNIFRGNKYLHELTTWPAVMIISEYYRNIHLSNGLFFFERCILITATVCAYKLNNAR